MNTKQLLSKFVSIPSYFGPKQNEAEMIKEVKAVFKGSRYKIEEQKIASGRINLFIHDKTTPKIILLGHMDTVPPKKETKDSFKPTIDRGKLYGLGSGDMKAGLAVAISLMLQNKKPGLALIASVDEEYNCDGARSFVAKYKLKPKMVINPEPTDLQILNGCRGILEFTFEVRGVAAHAGKKHLGVNAIEKSAQIALELQEELKKYDIKNSSRNSVNLARLNGGNLTGYAENGTPLISSSGNQVPAYAFNHIEIRTASSKVNLGLIQKLLAKMTKKHGVKIEKLALKTIPVGSMFIPAFELKGFEGAVKEAKLPLKYQDINDAGYYEAQIFREAWNCPVVIFGPGPSSMSHKANEYVDLDTVEKTEKVIKKYLEYNL